MIDYESLWARTLQILPLEVLDEVSDWAELDQVSAVTEARGRTMYRTVENNGSPTPESIRQIVFERLG